VKPEAAAPEPPPAAVGSGEAPSERRFSVMIMISSTRLPTGVDCCGAKEDSNHLLGPPTCSFGGREHVHDVRTNLFLRVRRFVTLRGGPNAPQ
jgi:hypothetical protein